MEIRTTIETLSSLRAVSGYEFRIADKIEEIFSLYCDKVERDVLGTVMGIIQSSRKDAPRIIIEAHMDEIGMMITDIDERGFLYFTNIGGIDPRILPAKEVVVHGRRDILGIIGAKPPHVTTAEQREKTIPISELFIDTGFSYEDIKELVSVGDTVTFDCGTMYLGTSLISTKSQDDRTGVAILINLMQRLKGRELPFDVYFCACVQEEVGRRGAAAMATYIDPVFAVAIDVCHASTPDALEGTFKLGSGTVISRGPNIHPVLLKKLLKIMDENKIKYSIDVDGDDTGTDAWAIQTAREGIPTALFSLPLRYMHTMVETVSEEDVMATADAIYSLIVNTDDAEEAVCLR